VGCNQLISKKQGGFYALGESCVSIHFDRFNWLILTTAIPHVFVLVDGVPLMAIREIIRMKVTAKRDAMVMSRRNLFLWVGSMGIRNFIFIFSL